MLRRVNSGVLQKDPFAQARKLFLYPFLLGLSIALIRDTAYQGQDFEVFWRAGLNLRLGFPLYSLERDGVMVFKYPPWIATLFLPFSFLPLSLAKWIWGILQIASLAFLVRSFLFLGISRLRVWIVTLSFWGIWAVHALDGQIMLPVLAVLWWLEAYNESWWKKPIFLALSTVKGTTVFASVHPLLGPHTLRERIRLLFQGGLAVLLLFLPVVLLGNDHSTLNIMSSWWHAANSGDVSFGLEKTLGRENQSFTALIQRIIFWTGGNPSQWGLQIAAILGSIFGFVWWKGSSEFKPEEKLAGWLAIVPLIHPLSWIHTFTWAFPLAVFSTSWNEKRNRFFSILGFVCLILITEKTLGVFGRTLETFSIKSWGVLLLLFALRADLSERVENSPQ